MYDNNSFLIFDFGQKKQKPFAQAPEDRSSLNFRHDCERHIRDMQHRVVQQHLGLIIHIHIFSFL